MLRRRDEVLRDSDQRRRGLVRSTCERPATDAHFAGTHLIDVHLTGPRAVIVRAESERDIGRHRGQRLVPGGQREDPSPRQ